MNITSKPNLTTLTLFIFVMLLSFNFDATCQLSGIGFGGGGSLSSFQYGDQVNNVDQFDNGDKGGGTGGIRFDFDLGTEFVKISPELFIIQNGAKEFYQDLSVVQTDLINRRVAMDYVGLYIPLTLYIPIDNPQTNVSQYYFNGFMLQGRLFGDYVVNAQVLEDFPGLPSASRGDVEFKSDADRFDYGFSVEGGFVVQGFKVVFGYNWGIKNIEFSNALGDVDDDNYLINNRGFTLQLGYMYKIQGNQSGGYSY